MTERRLERRTATHLSKVETGGFGTVVIIAANKSDPSQFWTVTARDRKNGDVEACSIKKDSPIHVQDLLAFYREETREYTFGQTSTENDLRRDREKRNGMMMSGESFQRSSR